MGRIVLSEPQSRAFWSKAKSVGVVAGFGSGKTYAALTKAFDLLLEYPGVPVGYAAPTYGLIKDIWYPAIEQHCIEHGFAVTILKSEHVVKVHGLGKIICRSLSNPDKIVGFEVGDFLIDEMDILNTEDALNAWRKCKARARFKFPKKKMRLPFGGYTKKIRKKNQMFAYTTPEGFKATYQLFKKDPIPGSELIQMSTYSNADNLPDDYIDELRANYPAQLIEAYINGQFVNLVAMPVWFGYDRKRNRSDEVITKEDNQLIVGMDFNVGRGCSVIYVERPNGLHAVDEITGTYDTNATIQVLKERYNGRNITVFPDASGSSRRSVNATISDIALLKQAGFAVKANTKNPAIKDRVTAMNARLFNGKGDVNLFINDRKCKNFAEGLEQQVYDDNGLPKKGEGAMDDITDAGSYPIATLFPIKKPKTKQMEMAL